MGPSEAFIGRRGPRQELEALIARRLAGRGGLGIVVGEAGIGKTALVEAVTSGQPTLWSRAREGWGAPPLWLWDQVLRDAHRRGWTDRPAARLDGSDVGVVGTGHDRFRRFDELTRALLDLGDQHGAVIVLDDLQWADAESAALLDFLAPDLASSHLVVLATARRDELAVLPRADVAIALAGLPADELRELLADLIDDEVDEQLLATVSLHTGGNPLFVGEAARLLRASGHATDPTRWRGVVPEGVRAVLSRRLARLPQATHDALAAAAVLGHDVDATALAALLELDRPDADDRLDPAVAAGLLRDEGGGHWRFSHALVRAAVEDALAPTRRRALHARAAIVLEVIGGDRAAAAIAEHLTVAGDGTGAAAWAGRAGDAAFRAAMYADAADWYRRAAATDRSPDLRCRLADALSRSGGLAEADAEYMAAARDARAAGDGAVLARAALGIGTIGGGFEVRLLDATKLTLLTEALARLDETDTAMRAVLTARLSVASTLQADHGTRVELAERAVAVARRVGDHAALAYALDAWCDAHAGPDDVALRLAAANEMLTAARWAGDPELELLALRLLVVASMEDGDVGRAARHIESFGHLADALRQPHFTWYARLAEGMLALLHGDLVGAERLGREAAALGARAQSNNARMLADGALLPLVARARGDADFVGRIVAMNRDEPESTRGVDAFGLYAVGYGADRATVERAVAAAPHVAIDRHDGLFLLIRCLIADGAAFVGDRTVMDDAYADLEPYAAHLVLDGTAAVCYGPVSTTLARIAAARGDREQARRWYDHASQILSRIGAPLLLQRVEQEVASLDTAEPADVAVIAREADAWLVGYAGSSARLRHAKGLSDLAVLVAQPGREVHVLDLVAAAEGRSPSAARTGWGHEVIDATARAAYEQRVRDLSEDLDEATAHHDLARAARLEAELDAVATELARSLGLSGRVRRTTDDTERARKAVGMRLRASIDRIAEQLPALGHHLQHAVRTGIYCSYQPEHPVTWRTEP